MKRPVTASLAFLGISMFPGFGQQPKSQGEEMLMIDNVITSNAQARAIFKSQGKLKGMDNQGNANYSSGICVVPGDSENKIGFSFGSEADCAKKKPSAYARINKGEYIENSGATWNRMGKACAAMEGNPQRVTLGLAKCLMAGIMAMQVGPNGNAAGPAAPQRK